MAFGRQVTPLPDDQTTSLESPWMVRSGTDRLLVLGIVLVAFIVRSVPVLRGAGLEGYLGYDDGVYFSAAVALVDGLLPYRDFLLLHPPGIALLLSPFALLAGATDDATGFAVARVAFMAIGAANAGLVALAAGRFGRRAGILSGILYAVWYSAARAERTTILIAPQTMLLLIAVLILFSVRRPSTRRAVVAGVALGLAVAIQAWAVVPLAVIVGTVALTGSASAANGPRRTALAVLAGAAGAFAAVCLPFFLAAPGAFVRLVLVDQVARPNLGISIVTRLKELEGFAASGSVWHLGLIGIIGLALVGVAALLFVARRVPAARMWCVLLALEVGYLLIAPNFYSHYSGWIAPAAAIVLGTAAASAMTALGHHRRSVVFARIAYGAMILVLAFTIPRRLGVPLQRATLEGALDGARCVSADAPDLLIETSGLQRDIRDGCQLVIDPTGTSYDTDRGRLAAGPVGPSRSAAPGYQAAMEEYYDDSNAAMFTQPGADGLTPSTREEVSDELPIVVKDGPVTLMLPGASVSP